MADRHRHGHAVTAPDPHGTLAAWRRHLVNGGQPCRSCEMAHQLALEARQRARLDMAWRELLDLIAGECRRAGMLP